MQSGKACGAACGDDVFQLLAWKIRSVLTYHGTCVVFQECASSCPRKAAWDEVGCLSATPSALSCGLKYSGFHGLIGQKLMGQVKISTLYCQGSVHETLFMPHSGGRIDSGQYKGGVA